jgi:hypothetical protein
MGTITHNKKIKNPIDDAAMRIYKTMSMTNSIHPGVLFQSYTGESSGRRVERNKKSCGII